MADKKRVEVKNENNSNAFATVDIGVNFANNYLPDIMRIRREEGELRMYLYVNTGLKDKDDNAITEWKNIHVLYNGKCEKDFLLGFIKGIEALSNYERILQAHFKSQEFEKAVMNEGKKEIDLRK